MNTPAFPTESGPVTLAGPAGRIEAVVELPAPAEARPLVAIVCHPLSTDGGSMHNKVVTMAARALRESGATTVRFNFRSVGASEGEFDHGEGEPDDLRAVAAWVRAQRPHDTLWLAGFSFGAYVTLSAAAELQPGLLLSIAPPVAGRGWDFTQIKHPNCPWLVIQGEADEIVDAEAVYAWVEQLKPPPELVRMPDTSHFFHHRLMDLRGAIKSGVRAYLPPASA
ncbi:alpha/beta family hydrolase [Lysobacter sp. CFH 32150]|uniref:alpha/beta hydrolase n=1 Tax=Lysobacter sp. CFH 32150 TaxID=2927128 RepID=UPI001FA72A00|nr:alpha/beta family hydrolase [Lysobacter sp. CFH 32150]MCI4567952.1 alpha/beta hydrolase [Lysobacter sp. CFH 32150]